MAGRNRRIAAWAFIVAMAFGCREAAALDLSAPASSLTQTSAASPIPALPGIPVPSLVPPNPVPVPVPANEAPTTSEPAPPPNSPASTSAPAQASRVLDEPASRTAGNAREADAATDPAPTGVSKYRAQRRARRVRGSQSLGARRKQPPAFERSRFGQLGELIDAGSPSQIFTDFSGGTPGSGMSWAVPLLAIMLPIGLCGFLQSSRRPSRTAK
jgi:hypothetical protein